ncbi:MAG TPA: XRE family transcriptional regulator [Nitrospirae bacterium]|nr:XRE family transcriptional regulator [Nitrospirota bacterium]
MLPIALIEKGGCFLLRVNENLRCSIKKAKKTVNVSVGDSVRIIRELQEMSRNDLAEATGIPQSTIFAIENDRVKPGVERAKGLTINNIYF